MLGGLTERAAASSVASQKIMQSPKDFWVNRKNSASAHKIPKQAKCPPTTPSWRMCGLYLKTTTGPPLRKMLQAASIDGYQYRDLSYTIPYSPSIISHLKVSQILCKASATSDFILSMQSWLTMCLIILSNIVSTCQTLHLLFACLTPWSSQ